MRTLVGFLLVVAMTSTTLVMRASPPALRLRIEQDAPVFTSRVAAVTFYLSAAITAVAGASPSWSGRAASMAFDRQGALHLAYVDDRGVIYRATDGSTTVISPKGARPDARGEVGPLLLVGDDGSMAVLYSNRTDAKWSSALVLQTSVDRGRTWAAPVVVNDDAKAASHSFTDAVLNRRGDVVATWLDSRTGHQGVQAAIVPAHGKARPNTVVDSVTCECCRTALLTAADGAVWLAYRDVDNGNIRNMSYAVSRDGGATFTRKGYLADDRWSVNGCPESGPRLAQAPDGTVWAAWFNGAAPAIQLARFRANAFEAPRKVAAPDATVSMVNHPELGVLPDGRVVVFYEAIQRDGTPVVMARSGDAAPIVVARHADSPRFARRDRNAALAFTEHREGKAYVRIIDQKGIVELLR